MKEHCWFLPLAMSAIWSVAFLGSGCKKIEVYDASPDASTDGDADTDSDTDTDSDSDGDADADSDTDSDADGDADTDTDTDADTDSDTDADTDSDTESESETEVDTEAEQEACVASGSWYDLGQHLCWEDPPLSPVWDWFNAESYCDGLIVGDLEHWRMPTIDEVVGLLRGCVDGTVVGDSSPSECPVADPDCLAESCAASGCDACAALGGPDGDPEGCYWPAALGGDCGTYWSVSPEAANPESAWYVSFVDGTVDWILKEGGTAGVRCVRVVP